MVAGTTCDVPVPPNLCQHVGGAVKELAWRGAWTICVVIFVPVELIPKHSNRDPLVRYRRDLQDILVRCIPEPAGGTNFLRVVSCVVSYLLDEHGQPPTILIVSRAGLTGYHFGFGGMISITLPALDAKAYILPHVSLIYPQHEGILPGD